MMRRAGGPPHWRSRDGVAERRRAISRGDVVDAGGLRAGGGIPRIDVGGAERDRRRAPPRAATASAGRRRRRSGPGPRTRSPPGSRPIASSALEERVPLARRSRSCRSVLSGVTAGRSQPSRDRGGERDAARRFWPPSQIGGPPGVSGGGSFVARRRAGRTGPPGHAGRRVAASAENSAWSVSTADSNRSNRSGIGGSGIPNGVVLALEPAGAEAEDEPAAGDVVEDGRRLREQRRAGGRCSTGRRGRAIRPGTWWASAARSGQRLPATGPARVAARGRSGGRSARPLSKTPVLADPRPGRVERRPVDVLGRSLDPDRDGCPSRRPRSARRRHPRPGRSPRPRTPSRPGRRTWP